MSSVPNYGQSMACGVGIQVAMCLDLESSHVKPKISAATCSAVAATVPVSETLEMACPDSFFGVRDIRLWESPLSGCSRLPACIGRRIAIVGIEHWNNRVPRSPTTNRGRRSSSRIRIACGLVDESTIDLQRLHSGLVKYRLAHRTNGA